MGTKTWAGLWAAAAALLCMLILYGGADMGLSDNGDYKRMLDSEGISYIQNADNQYYFRRYYQMIGNGDGKIENLGQALKGQNTAFYGSIQNYFVKAAKALNYGYNLCTGRPRESFDIFWLAVIYISLFGTAVYWILSAIQKRWTQFFAACLILFIFCDSGYILYFNSWYGEALQFVAVFLILGSGMRWRLETEQTAWLVLFYLGLMLFAGAKQVNVLLAGLTGAGTAALQIKWGHKNRIIWLCAAVLIAYCGYSYLRIPAWMNRDTLYQSVFFGVLKGTENPKRDLEELGLDPAYAPLAGTHAYLEEYPLDVHGRAFMEGFYGKISRIRVAGYYFRHPGRLLEKLDIALANSRSIRPVYLANSAQTYGGTTERWGCWNRIRGWFWPLYRLWLVLPAIIGWTAYSIYRFVWGKGKWTAHWAGGCLLAAGLWINFVLPVLCNGEADLAKHMILYTQLTDLAIAYGILYGSQNLTSKRGLLCAAALLVGFGTVPDKQPLVEFGTWNGKPIRWEIVNMYADGTVDLVAHTVLAYQEFDTAGGNFWHTSSLRQWLNTEFIRCFSPQEQKLLVPAARRVLLPQRQRDLAEGGWHPHYWAYPKTQCADMQDSAWYHTVWDLVSLPDVEQLQQMDIAHKAGFWLTTPYCQENHLVRFADVQGRVANRNAQEAGGIRPIIRILWKF